MMDASPPPSVEAEAPDRSPSTDVAAAAPASPVAAGRRGGALAYLVMVVGCVTAADLLLKRGAMEVHTAAPEALATRLGIGALASAFTIGGILCHLGGLAAWMSALRRVPLTIAYCFIAVQQATIALGAWLWLGEQISWLRAGGIALVMAGVLLLVPAIVAAEARTERRGGGRDGMGEEHP